MKRLISLIVFASLALFGSDYVAPRALATPLNLRSYASERASVMRAFPKLGTSFEVMAPSTGRYNCIAWSLGITTQWVWPGDTVAAFDTLNARYGYRRAASMDVRLDSRYEKILLFAKAQNGRWVCTHQARQLADGSWSSKLGAMALIRTFNVNGVNGATYGQPIAMYYRLRR